MGPGFNILKSSENNTGTLNVEKTNRNVYFFHLKF